MIVTVDSVEDLAQHPLRVNEGEVRQFILNNPDTNVGRIMSLGRFSPGGRGSYAAVVVVVLSDSPAFPSAPYSTHLAAVRTEPGRPAEVFLLSGHYDLTYEVALNDMLKR